MRERFNAGDKACMLRFHTQTGGSTLTAQQINNNIVRVAFQALAAVLGGTQSLHTNARDEALALPTEDSARIALRTQQIIANESGVINTADPVGGSYVIEAETQRIMKDALHYIEKIDAMGGAVKAVEAGFIQNEIQAAAYATQQAIESGAQGIVGVNKYTRDEGRGTRDEAGGEIAIFKIDPMFEKKQQRRIASVKTSRDATQVKATLAALSNAAMGLVNLMPYIVDAVRAYATLGEISNALRTVFGEYQYQNSI
jgi:methylmalonyl-CoA mutase N-terminal domain/subunit